jgi:DNA repair exonuclease SbcCD ATPase subunit
MSVSQNSREVHLAKLVEEQQISLASLTEQLENQKSDVNIYRDRISQLEKLVATQRTSISTNRGLDDALKEKDEIQRNISELAEDIQVKQQVIQTLAESTPSKRDTLEQRLMSEIEDTKRQMLRYDQQIDQHTQEMNQSVSLSLSPVMAQGEPQPAATGQLGTSPVETTNNANTNSINPNQDEKVLSAIAHMDAGI